MMFVLLCDIGFDSVFVSFLLCVVLIVLVSIGNSVCSVVFLLNLRLCYSLIVFDSLYSVKFVV